MRAFTRLAHPAYLGAIAGLLTGCLDPGQTPQAANGAGQLPIQPTRTIRFETREGSEMNVDVSPDGRTLVFDLLGDLYAVPITGGRARQLTRGMGVDRRPVWSPDGRHLAYLSDATGAETIWLVEADGTEPRPIAPERLAVRMPWVGPLFTAVEWAPDGQYLVSDDTLYHREGREPQRALGLNATRARFSPDGRYIYFISRRDRDSVSWSGAAGSFYGMESSGGPRRYDHMTDDTLELAPDLTNGRVAYQPEPVVSPDGVWLAYITLKDTALWIRHLPTGEDRRLAQPVAASRTGRGGRFVFTPDSRAVLLGYGGKLHRIDVSTGRDVVIPFTARVQVDLGPLIQHQYRILNDSVRVRAIRSPTVSPDGKALVFTAVQRLYTMALPGGTPKRLVEQPDGQFQPAYSPDGQWIAYVTWSDVEGGHVWRLPAAGGIPERLTREAGYYQRPAWAPDGATLAVLKCNAANVATDPDGWSGALLVLPSGGGNARAVVDRVWCAMTPTFSADGQRMFALTSLVYESRVEPDTLLLSSVRLDGSDRQIVARLTAHLGSAARIVPAPDGRHVVFSAAYQWFMAQLSRQGGPTILDAATAVPLTYGARDVVWSPDSRTLTWAAAGEVGRAERDQVLARRPPGSTPQDMRAVPSTKIPVVLTEPRHIGRRTLVLRGARVVTMKGDEVLEDATLVITNDRITAVGPSATLPVPTGATVLDLRGTTIIPGLVDMHGHVGPARQETFASHDRAYMANLAYGVTTSRNASGPLTGFDDAELIETGRLLGPRLFHAGGPSITGFEVKIESLEDARVIAQHRQAMGAVVAKQYEVRTRRQRQWVHQALAEAGINVMAHHHFDVILDGATTVEHPSLTHTDLHEDMVRLIAASGTAYTPTLITKLTDVLILRLFADGTAGVSDAKYRRFGGDWHESIERAAARDLPDFERGVLPYFEGLAREGAAIVRQGGYVTMGGHSNFAQGLGSHVELWAIHHGGLTSHEALRAATLHGAVGLGMSQDLGSLEVGKLADLLVLDANPLEQIQHTQRIRYVMKNGVLYDGDTLDTLWPIKESVPAWMYQR